MSLQAAFHFLLWLFLTWLLKSIAMSLLLSPGIGPASILGCLPLWLPVPCAGFVVAIRAGRGTLGDLLSDGCSCWLLFPEQVVFNILHLWPVRGDGSGAGKWPGTYCQFLFLSSPLCGFSVNFLAFYLYSHACFVCPILSAVLYFPQEFLPIHIWVPLSAILWASHRDLDFRLGFLPLLLLGKSLHLCEPVSLCVKYRW